MNHSVAPAAAPALKRELGLRDVTLFAIACIVGTRWIPAAACAGPGSVSLLLLAASAPAAKRFSTALIDVIDIRS